MGRAEMSTAFNGKFKAPADSANHWVHSCNFLPQCQGFGLKLSFFQYVSDSYTWKEGDKFLYVTTII